MSLSLLTEYLNQFGAWTWFILAGLLFIFEFLLPGFYLLFFGLSALITGLITYFVDINWQLQAIIFSAISVINIYVARIFWNPDVESDEPLLNKRGQQYIGRSFTLATPLTNGRGKVKVGDSFWPVSGPDLPEGATVKVVNLDGSTLVVVEN